MKEKKLLASLHRLFQNLETSPCLDEVLEQTRVELDQTIGFKEFWFHLLSEDRKHYRLLETTSKTVDLDQASQHLEIDGDLFLEELARSACPVIVEDARTDPRTNKERVRKFEHRTIVCIPTRLNQQRIGFFGTGSFGDQPVRRLNESECEYLRVIANHVALILDRAMITQQRQITEAQLFEKETKLNLATDLGLVGLWDLDLGNAPEADAPYARNSLSCTIHSGPESFQSWLGTIHPDDQEDQARLLSEQLSQPQNRLFLEYRTAPVNGQFRWLHSEGMVLRDESGRAVRLVGCHVDITDRRKAEEAATLHENQLRLFVEQAPVGIAMFDTNMNCLAASDRWTNEYGDGLSDKPGQNHYQTHPNLPERWREIHQRAMSGESLKNDCDQLILPNGLNIWFSWVAKPWHDSASRIGGIIMTYENLTPSKLLEVEVVEIASKEQQRIGQDLHDTVSQELTALRMLTRVLGDSLEAAPPKITTLVSQIESGLKRSMQELRDIMQGLMPVDVQPDNFIPALADLAEQAKRLGACNCILNGPAGTVELPDTFTATQLYLIAREAVHNAIKHCGPVLIEIVVKNNPDFLMIVKNECDHEINHQPNKQLGLGRQIMQNRASIIGARLDFETLSPNGMQVTCRLKRSN